MSVTVSKPQNITTIEGNGLALYKDATSNQFVVKDVNGQIELLPSGGGGGSTTVSGTPNEIVVTNVGSNYEVGIDAVVLNDISTNTTNIATNTSDISTNTANISTNTTDIATNSTDISTNTSNISTNTTDIATNSTDISLNTSKITTNSTDITNNTADITTNSTNIAINTTNIATNTSDIANLTANIPTSANPTAEVGDVAVNGTATTFMTSDSAPALRDSGVTADTYGDAKNVPRIVVDAKGRITSASNVQASLVANFTNAGEFALMQSTGVVQSSHNLQYTLAGSTNGLPTVGIGLNGVAPSKGALQIESFVDYSGQPSEVPFDFFIYTGAGGPFQNFAGVGLFAIGVHTSARLMGSGIHIFSDERIKKDIEISNSKDDLETISKIEICDYKYIDRVKGGAEKKVIAQQVQKHYPNAVNEGTDVIPCFMQKAEIKNGIINLDLDCVVGDRIKLMFPNGEQEISEVIEVNDKSVKVESTKNDDVFVYGKEVNDYQTVDYDALSMLNISATQELYKKIKDLKAELEELKKTCCK